MYVDLLTIRFCNKYITKSIYFRFEMMNLETYSYPKGLHLLESWQAGSEEAKAEIKSVFDAAISGSFDGNFSVLAPTNEVHATASVHMLALAILNDLYGVTSA